MKRPFFSVIMPVYNGGSFLREALSSVLSQTFPDFELIAVDDGSTDDTPEVLRKARADFRVRVVSLESNSGLSTARNAGMDVAMGEYLIFMDADDVIDARLYERLHSEIEGASPDVVIFGLKEAYIGANGETMHERAVAPEYAAFKGRREITMEAARLEARTLFGYAWNKAYSARIAAGIRFERTVLIEDFLFNMDFIRAADSMITLNETPYTYRIQSGKNLTARFEERYYEVHRTRVFMMYEMLARESLLDGEALRMLANRYSRYILSAAVRNLEPLSGMDAAGRRAFLRAVYADELYLSLRAHMGGPVGFAVRHRLCLGAMARSSRLLRRVLPAAFAKVKKYAR